MKRILNFTWQKLLIVLLFISGLLALLIIFGQKFIRKLKYNSVTEADTHREIARRISHALGTNINLRWFEGWTEDESEVIKLFEGLYLEDFQKISTYYRTVFTNGNDLKDDLIKYLSQDDLDYLTHLFYSQGKMPTVGAEGLTASKNIKSIFEGELQKATKGIYEGLLNKWNIGKA